MAPLFFKTADRIPYKFSTLVLRNRQKSPAPRFFGKTGFYTGSLRPGVDPTPLSLAYQGGSGSFLKQQGNPFIWETHPLRSTKSLCRAQKFAPGVQQLALFCHLLTHLLAQIVCENFGLRGDSPMVRRGCMFMFIQKNGGFGSELELVGELIKTRVEGVWMLHTGRSYGSDNPQQITRKNLNLLWPLNPCRSEG